ncbi:hypothetical protein [Cytobacillus praedii]|uniref:hypothetical protein n=1 Tax=Cytobacillus praedii TaxID=1742358 RepID=UPI00070D3BFB|nr:hypothetical protein [Cytobacillus praedii]
MKKLLPGIACLIISGTLAGCSTQTTRGEGNELGELKRQIEQLSIENSALQLKIEEQRKEMEQTNSNDGAVYSAKDIEEYPQTLYKKISLDIDMDEIDEIIELYVNAEKMETGGFAWDDGQTWLLVVKDGDKSYPLYNNYVQLGSIDFSMATFDGIPGIIMIETMHADKSVHKFSYDQEVKGFVKETLYKKENMFDQYNQPASFALFTDAYKRMKEAFANKAIEALEAGDRNSQDIHDRAMVFEPILVDLRDAQRLFETAGELNPALSVSIDSALNMLNQMVINPPTADQFDQLRSIHEVFNVGEEEQLIIEEKNQIHPDIINKFQMLDSIFNGNY